jgi:hypothetical protein
MIVVSGLDAAFQVSHRVWVLDFAGAAPPPINQPPIANAGVTRAVQIGASVTLDGSASRDPDGDALTFSWQFVEKPAGSAAALAGASTATPAFTADLAGTYLVRLTVSDSLGAASTAVVTITAAASTNRPPIANAGPDQSVNAGATVRLNGSLSRDPDGTPLTFAWTLRTPSGSTGSLSGASTSRPSFVASQTGTYTARLTVSDGSLGATDSVVVRVAAACLAPPTCVKSTTASNQPYHYQCNGRQITQTADPSFQDVDDFRLVGCTAVWRFNELREVSPDQGKVAYYSNDARTGSTSTIKQLTQKTGGAAFDAIRDFRTWPSGEASWLYDSATGLKVPGEAYFANCVKSPVLSTPEKVTPTTGITGGDGAGKEVINDFTLSERTFTWVLRNPSTNTDTPGSYTMRTTCQQP